MRCPHCRHLLDGADVARALRALPSPHRAEASRQNGRRGGCPPWSPQALALRTLRAASESDRPMALARWLAVASPQQIQRNWRKWMGPRPDPFAP